MPINNPEIYWSFDVEADGPYPGQYSMVSIGLVPCYISDGTPEGSRPINIENDVYSIYYEFCPISTEWDPEALAISGLDRNYLWENGVEPKKAILHLEQKIRDFTSALHPRGRAVAVAYPLGFDWMWYYWYSCKFGMGPKNPFGFSGCLDIKSLYAAKANALVVNSTKRNMPAHLKSQLPHTHNALDDAKEQAVLFQRIKEWEGK